ncbi:helix-turn-helix domain-containing protein [Brevibacillus centrosporus]|jgi:AcrR family transcriptional regulator|uniref:helix-turn-helix domain-containing protein n=1 Tax=Brevibacillus centrosporus TaxID=54910 RepID=UPI002E24B46A|nr:helix-turn-helix domain containing protein [Brevibacillus centrosporus]
MNRKEVKLKRMLQYFVDATVEIINEEGLENVTARKIADRAGYTGSTIYNYFEELSHLVYFASMRFVNEYMQDLPNYLVKSDSYLEKYLLSWECFCKHSFHNPKIYHAIFISDLGKKPKEVLEHYFSIYSSELLGFPEEIKPLLYNPDLVSRSREMLEMAKKESDLDEQMIEEANEMAVLIWEGMMTTLLNRRRDMDIQEGIKKTMLYIRNSMKILER